MIKEFFKIQRIAKNILKEKDWKVYFSPGRINLIGEHIDYNGGLVMPCSLDLGIIGAFHPRKDQLIQCYSHEYSGEGLQSFSLTDLKRTNHWTDYVKGVVAAFNQYPIQGFDLVMMSHLPIGAGLSSSACLEMLVATYLNNQYKIGISKIELAKISQKVENEFVGVQCGIMDQFAVAIGEEKKAILLNTHTLEYEMIPADFQEYQIIIANTSKSRTLAGSKYNERRQECNAVLKRLQQELMISSLCEVPLNRLEDFHHLIPEDTLYRRLRHVVSENERTIQSKLALKKGDMEAFGQHLISSHQSLANDYEVSCEELDFMVSELIKHGAIGARMTGAGFGGCAIALVHRSQISTLIREVTTSYRLETHLKPEFYIASIGSGTTQWTYSIQEALSNLLKWGLDTHLFYESEWNYRRNHVLHLFHLTDYQVNEPKIEIKETLDDLLDDLVEYGHMENLLRDDTLLGEGNFISEVMDCLCESPKNIIHQFQSHLHQSPSQATNYLFQYAINSRYIQTRSIAKNISWQYHNSYGDLIITINMSKPEKDPLMIKRLREAEETSYPQCQLCVDNEGFGGSLVKESRKNMRIVPVTLNQESWFFQYSPYSYYQEHAIVLKKEHTPMIIKEETFIKLVDFVSLFPHYFVGSNADLPIVGGSILTHEHFQCGCAKMPIENAKMNPIATVENVKMYQLVWPLSTIRLVTKDKKALIKIATRVLQKWQSYENKTLNIVNLPILHNTITPICRFKKGEWIMDLILRNNLTTEAFPMGVFHPKPELHHIKKENIGLIEAMGIAILPARLKNELAWIEEVLLEHRSLLDYPDLKKHEHWIIEMQKQSKVNLEVEVGKKFVEVLEDAGVFKQTKKGQEAFIQFIKTCS
ncbi:MAG: galactokinase [Bacilli bacterium]|nr:galactokinase [Bacilli bacterium]